MNNFELIVGCDEVGRGSLIGRVYAACVILPIDYVNKNIKDSKLINENKRNILNNEIKLIAIDYGIDYIDNNEIDEINILNASIKAMHKSLDRLKKIPNKILVDGNKFKPYRNIPYECIIKGDSKIQQISAASIIAKVERDNYIYEIDKLYPEYNWKNNKGYGTKEHINLIKKYGLSPLHRKSFIIKELNMLF